MRRGRQPPPFFFFTLTSSPLQKGETASAELLIWSCVCTVLPSTYTVVWSTAEATGSWSFLGFICRFMLDGFAGRLCARNQKLVEGLQILTMGLAAPSLF